MAGIDLIHVDRHVPTVNVAKWKLMRTWKTTQWCWTSDTN